jgi:hypothetical protein
MCLSGKRNGALTDPTFLVAPASRLGGCRTIIRCHGFQPVASRASLPRRHRRIRSCRFSESARQAQWYTRGIRARRIERAKRFAATLTNVEDRERFKRAADDYQREINALSAVGAKSDASEPSDAVAAMSKPDTAAPSDAIAATNEGAAITSTNDTGPQETD